VAPVIALAAVVVAVSLLIFRSRSALPGVTRA